MYILVGMDQNSHHCCCLVLAMHHYSHHCCCLVLAMHNYSHRCCCLVLAMHHSHHDRCYSHVLFILLLRTSPADIAAWRQQLVETAAGAAAVRALAIMPGCRLLARLMARLRWGGARDAVVALLKVTWLTRGMGCKIE